MKVVVAHQIGDDATRLRRAVLGTGLQCSAEDCVLFEDLPLRLSAAAPSLVMLQTSDGRNVDWEKLRQTLRLSHAPTVLVGSTDAVEKVNDVTETSYIDESNLRRGLDEFLAGWEGIETFDRGHVHVVASATPGSGGTTIATNLAGVYNRMHKEKVGLLEFATRGGDAELLLGESPEYTTREVAGRSETLDRTSLLGSVTSHRTGLKFLATSIDEDENCVTDVEATLRIAILSRVAFQHTVISSEGTGAENELELMKLADRTLIVLRPDVPSVRGAQKLLAVADSAGVPAGNIQIVVNRWGQRGQLSTRQITDALGKRHMHFVCDAPARVNTAANRGQLLCESAALSRVTRQIGKLAKALA